MIDKLGGYKTEIRILERKLKEMDHSKLSPAKVKEVTEAIKNLKDLVKEKEDKREERRKKKEEAAKVEATVAPIEVVKESAPAPTEEVVKEADVNKFAVDSKVEPIRGTPGSWGVIIREAGVNGDPLCYVKWMEGTLKTAHGDYGAYYPSDLKLKAEIAAEAKDPTAYVPREQLYNLEADLKSNYERMISDMEEEIKMAQEKGELTWVGRLEEKLNDIQKAYQERFSEKTASEHNHDPKVIEYMYDCPKCVSEGKSKKAEDENGSGGTNKLKVYDQNPAYDKDPQEKSTGYGGDRTYGWQTAPVRDDMTSLSASQESDKEIAFEKAVDRLDKKLMNHDLSQSEYDKQYEELKKQHKVSSLKFADLDLNSIEKRWALYVDGKLAIRTLTQSKAERIAKERFPSQLAAGKVEIKRENHIPVEASLDKQAIHITVAEKLFIVNSLQKTADNEYVYDVNLADGSKLFKITSKDEMGQEHLAYVIEKELTKKETPKMAKLTSNLAFLKKGSLVSIVAEDKAKGQIKFASLDNSLRGWAPSNKFAAFGDIEQKFMDHEGHKDEVFAESGNELLVACPQGTTNITWREITAPPATPESLNPDVASLKEAAACDQCNAAMINGVFCHETGCPNKKRQMRNEDILDSEEGYIESSLNKDAHIRHEDGKWVIYSHDYKKKLGTYDSKEEATKRLRQIEYFKHQGSMQPLSKKEAEWPRCSVESCENKADSTVEGKRYCYTHSWGKGPKNMKEANVMETKCEECGKELGPEVFLSKWPVCGKCTKKRHKKVVGKKADQELSLADQVQGFKDRMQAVNDRLATPPAKTADLETTQDLSNVDVKDLSNAILHIVDLLESKVGENVSADPELHPMLEDLENKVYEIEMKMGIKPELPEHERLEPEHSEIVKELGEEPVEKDSNLEVKADDVNTPPPNLPPAGFRYAWDPKNMNWILVQITGAPGGGQ